MATATPAVLQPPYVTSPQVIYVQAPPPSEPSFGNTAATALTYGGRFYSVIGAVVGVIIMIIMIIMGFMKLRDKHTASAPMTVEKVDSCTQHLPDGQGNFTTIYVCSIMVSFVVNGKTYSSSSPLKVKVPAPLKPGDTITLRYDPNNPADITQEGSSPKTMGWMLIGGGVAFGALSVGIAVLTFKSKGFAEFEGAAGLLSAFRG